MASCPSCGARATAGARFCAACGSALAATVPGDERKLATVLFADLVGSTAAASDEDPERVRQRLTRFYDAMTEEIVRAGGTVEKFAGDAVMAAFGAPAALEDHAERALHAALAMHHRLQALFGGALALRVGVNTGEVVVGRPREGSSFVSGDTVNVARRLEQAAAAGEVLAGQRTALAARGAFELGPERVVAAKGKEGGVACRPVLRALSLVRPRGVGGVGTVFVGRDSELELLLAAYRRVCAGRSAHLVSVAGEPGVGKSRLVRELWECLGDDPEPPLRRTGRCLAYGAGIAYWPLAAVVREHFTIHERDPPEVVLRRLGDHVPLAPALGLDVAGDVYPLEARNRLHEAFCSFFAALAAERPVAVLVEDVHWAEDELLELLDRILRDVAAPLLLIVTARPEFLETRPAWGGARRNTATVWLEPLAPPDAERMLDGLLGDALTPPLRAEIATRSEGNPFFVEELVGSLVDAGALVRTESGWRSGELPEGFAVPDSVQAVLAARIDRLPAPAKEALQSASVIGRVFWQEPLRALVEGDEPELALLEDRDFVRRLPLSTFEGDEEWSFKHALTREVAYAGLPKARRARLHAAFADWLHVDEGSRDEHAALLAHHYAEAVLPEDADLAWADDAAELARLRRGAVEWLRRAAELARRRYELTDAAELLRRAVALAETGGERAELWRSVGDVCALAYDGEGYSEAMRRALELERDEATRAETLGELVFHTSVRASMWRQRPRLDVVDGWIDEALATTAPGSVAHARALLGRAGWHPEDEVAARSAYEAASALDDPELRSYAVEMLLNTALEHARYGEAAELAQRGLSLLGDALDPDVFAKSYESAVSALTGVAAFDDARRLAALHVDLSRRLSSHHRMHAVSLGVEIAEHEADWDAVVRARGDVERAAAENARTPCIRNARTLLLCATAAAARGDLGAAEVLERAADAARFEGYDGVLAPARVRLALLRGDLPAVRALLDVPPERVFVWGPSVLAARLDAIAALRDRERAEREARRLLEPGAFVEPFALRALGIVRGDDALLAQAGERFSGLGLGWHAAQTDRLLAG